MRCCGGVRANAHTDTVLALAPLDVAQPHDGQPSSAAQCSYTGRSALSALSASAIQVLSALTAASTEC